MRNIPDLKTLESLHKRLREMESFVAVKKDTGYERRVNRSAFF